MNSNNQLAELVKNYWDSRADSYDDSIWHTCCPEVWEKLLRAMLPVGSMVLDIGVGTGFITQILSRIGWSYIVAIDISPKMLAKAVEKLAPIRYVVELVEADAAALPLRDNAVDAAVARHVLWTLHSPEETLREVARCVRVYALFTFSVREAPPPSNTPSTPLRWIKDSEEVLKVTIRAGVRAEILEASWVRREQERVTRRRIEGEKGYYALIVYGYNS